MSVVNSRIEISTKQAPISKVIIYPDKLDILSGFEKPRIIKTFQFTDKTFLNKFLSFPIYLNELLKRESNNVAYMLEGLNVSDSCGFIPTEEEYDLFDKDDYYKKAMCSVRSDREIEFLSYINNYHVMILYSYTYNLHKEYNLVILHSDYEYSLKENDEDDGSMNRFENVRLYNPMQRLSLCFMKEDVVVYIGNKIIDYGKIEADAKFNRFVENATKESGEIDMVCKNDDIGVIITRNRM